MLEPSLISAEHQLASSLNIASNEFCDNNVFFAENNDPREQILWNVNKSRIDFYKYDCECQNQLVSCFNFEEIYNDPSVVISFVIRCIDRFEESHNRLHLFKVIVTLNSREDSSVVILDIIAGTVLSTISFPYIICSIDLISGGKASNLNRPFGDALLPLDGILAVGTVGGNVFLLDLRLDSLPEDPLSPTQVTFSNIYKANIKDVTLKRSASVQHDQNLAFMMNSFAKTKNNFVYTQADKKTILDRFAAQNVYVSCLYYIPTNCSLAIGYNFGGLQMISLQNDFQLELSEELKCEIPVIGFSHQLPESDPKNFIYFWVIRGIHQKSLALETNEQCSLCSKAYLYRALYDKRTDTNFGISYSKFIQYERVFYIPLVFNPLDFSYTHKNTTLSKLLEIFSISKYFTIDGQEVVDNRYTLIMWSAEASNSEKIVTHFLIFDLNQWYSCFEPKCLNVATSPYLTVYSLESVNGFLSNRDRVQALNFQTNSIRKFLFKRFNLLECEKVFNSPRSLSFNVMVSSQEKLFMAKFLSVPKRVLNDVFNRNSDIFANPGEFINKLNRSGLISEINSSENDTEIILNTALIYSQMQFFKRIIAEDNKKSEILKWITNQIVSIKKNIDDNTSCLFDYSGSSLSPEQQIILNSCGSNLRYLMTILKLFKTPKISAQLGTIENFEDKINGLTEILELLENFLKIIFNLHHLNILPERQSQNCYPDQAFYDGERMRETYENERKNVMSLCPIAFADPNKVLVIDLIVQYYDESLKSVWKLEGEDINDLSTPLYPPKNLHCLCRTFILENDAIPKLIREFILIYFLIDYSQITQQDQEFLSSMLQFFRSNLMDSKMQDLVVGIYHADHGDYDVALSFFCSSNTLKAFKELRILVPDLLNEILDRIVELFIFHDRPKQALNFIEISEIFPLDDVNESLYIYLLVCDFKLSSAIDFQRKRRTEEYSQLFQKLLEYCDQKNCLHLLCFTELDHCEEIMFLSYLHESEQQSRRLILVFYYLSKNSFIQALNYVSNYDVDFSDVPQLLELIKCCENVVPIKELNSIEKGIEILQTSNEEIDKTELKFDDNQPRIKANPRKSSKIIVSRAFNIEQNLIAKESIIKNTDSIPNSLLPITPKQRKSRDYIPRISSSSMKSKLKLSVKKNPFASVLNTPDVKRQVLADVSTLSVNRPPSVLKRFGNDNESVHSTDSSKLKVNVKFKLPKFDAISPVQEDQQFIVHPDHSVLEKSLDVEDIEINETIASSNDSSNTSNTSVNISNEIEANKTLKIVKRKKAASPAKEKSHEKDEVNKEIKENNDLEDTIRRSSRRSVTPQRFDQFETATTRSRARSPSTDLNITLSIKRGKSQTPTRDIEENEKISTTGKKIRARTPTRDIDNTENVSTAAKKSTRAQKPTRNLDNLDTASTPLKRSTRARTPTRDMDEVNIASTPAKRSTRARTPTRDMDEVNTASTPVKRSTRARTPTRDMDEVNTASTPVKRSTRARTPTRNMDEDNTVSTPAKRSTRARTPTRNMDEDTTASKAAKRSTRARTPTRNMDEDNTESTPAKRTTRARTPTRNVDEDNTESKPAKRTTRARTPTRNVDEDNTESTLVKRSTSARTPTRDVV